MVTTPVCIPTCSVPAPFGICYRLCQLILIPSFISSIHSLSCLLSTYFIHGPTQNKPLDHKYTAHDKDKGDAAVSSFRGEHDKRD